MIICSYTQQADEGMCNCSVHVHLLLANVHIIIVYFWVHALIDTQRLTYIYAYSYASLFVC
jgi:hypothetical protein